MSTDRELVHEPLFRLRYGIVVGYKHPLAGKRKLSLRQVMEYRLAVADTWRVVLKNWDETFSREGLSPPSTSFGEATDEFFRDLISNCNTVAVLPMIGTISDALESGQLVELHVPRVDWSSQVAVIYRAGDTLSPDAQLLLEETRATLAAI